MLAISNAQRKIHLKGCRYPKAPLVYVVGGPMGPSVVVSQPLCLRGLDLHLSLLGFGLIHLPPTGPLEEATLGEEEGAWVQG